MRILVTGSSGRIGRSLVPRLLAAGHVVNSLDLVAGETEPAVRAFQGNITDVEVVTRAAADCEAIIHLAAVPVPWGDTEEGVFDANARGTFCVFRGAVATGIRRVLCASSINALGLYFGHGPVALCELPVTEEHPQVPTDPYSFSKHVAEDIATYFFRRDGISSISFRMGGNMRLDPQGNPDVRKAVLELLRLPREQGQMQARQILESFFARSRDLRERYSIPYPDHAIATGAANLFTALDERDRDRAFETALHVELNGAHVVNLADANNTLGIESELLAELIYPEAIRSRPLVGTESLMSTERARELLQFEPEYSVKRFY